MSFLGGAECSTAGNPLRQFTKHVQDDRSLQRDRLVNRGPGGLQEGMRSTAVGPAQDKLMDDFVQHQGGFPQHTGAASPFAMGQMRRELDQTQRGGSPAWAAEYESSAGSSARLGSMGAASTGRFSPADFAHFQTRGGPAAELHATNQSMGGQSGIMGYQRPMGLGGMGVGMGMGMGMSYGGMNRPFASNTMQPEQPLQTGGKGKERVVELDDQGWEAQFAELEDARAAGAENKEDIEANAAMERDLDAFDRSVPSQQSETDHFGDFESIWRGIQAEREANSAFTEDERARALEEWSGFDGLNMHMNRDPQLGDYMFEEDNFFREVADPFSEGLSIMNEGGNLSLAALAFEAAVQKDPKHVEAWVKLGAAQAQNEKETPAIRALEQALKLDPANLEALMGLAVSHTNEGYDTTAFRTLERWIATKYPSVVKEPLDTGNDIGFTDRQALHEKVTSLFLAAARLSPEGTAMDPDVQVGLGVLFYGAEEYDKAVDCFGAALDSTQAGTTTAPTTQHLLWNRLGATLANSGRSEEAIEAYERALAARPNFVRARYNLGVSCINVGCLPEAAQHLLGALAMHRVAEREGREKARELVGGSEGVSEETLDRMIRMNESTNLLDTLRRIFTQMERRDLAEKVGAGMDVDAFRQEFDF